MKKNIWIEQAENAIQKYIDVPPETNEDAVNFAAWLAIRDKLIDDISNNTNDEIDLFKSFLAVAEHELADIDAYYAQNRVISKSELNHAREYINKAKKHARTAEQVQAVKYAETKYQMMSSKIK